MRLNAAGPSLIIVSLLLAGCSPKGASETVPADQSAGVNDAGWSGRTARQFRHAIDARAAHALEHVKFETGGKPGSASADAALTRAALAYATALAQGATDPSKLYAIYTVPRPQSALESGLSAALKAGNVGEWLESLAPADPNYRRLSQAYVALVKGSTPNAPMIPDAGKPINPGATDPRIPLISRQLVSSDYLDRSPTGNRYSPEIVAAVRAMQQDYGIKPDGVIGSEALSILNLSAADRARAIAVNMERLRWLQRTPRRHASTSTWPHRG